MTENQQRLLVLAALAVGVCLFILFSWLKDRKKNSQPIYECTATIRSNRIISQTVRGGGAGHYNARSCMTVFELENGAAIELSAPEELCYSPVGTKGTLIYQGRKCEKFTPDE